MKQLSLIVSVLDSHEVVRRQLLYMERFLPPTCELIMVDDGSEPNLEMVCASVRKSFSFTLYMTHDRRPWTQPKARNLGAGLSRADKLLFFDIDHILTPEIIRLCIDYQGDKLHWVRLPGVLDQAGTVITDKQVLHEFGLTEARPSVHANSFMIRTEVFHLLGGYDEKFCGRYGGDDIDFNQRYGCLTQEGHARPEDVQGMGYVFPDPSRDVKKLFHALRREPQS